MAAVRSKTVLACDRCRQRKSRCDGVRPSCGHCAEAGRECVYRPTPTTLETDSAILSRLSDVEGRIQALEEQPGTMHHGAVATTGAAPDLHTASAHQMLHSWPRIRLCLTLADFNPLEYLAQSDAEDPTLVQAAGLTLDHPPLRVSHATKALKGLYSSLLELPVELICLFQSYEGLSGDNVLDGFALSHPSEDALLDPDQLSIQRLLSISVAMISYGSSGNGGSQSGENRSISAAYLSLSLQRSWTLLTSTQDRIALTLTMACCLIYYWARPFHALGLLQSIHSCVKRLAFKQRGNPLVLQYAKLCFILESDILSEVDEYSSNTTLSLEDGPTTEALFTPEMWTTTGRVDNLPSVDHFVDSHALLRLQSNRILHLYTPTKAYAQPHELAELVFGLSAELRRWYQSLPLSSQFPRDSTTFNIAGPSLPLHLRHLAIRYYSCVFLLNRPVLYFYLHRDMEYSVRPPNTAGVGADHGPWVLESCRDCIESASLIIQFCCISPASHTEAAYRHWCHLQLLFAAYLVTLQVMTLPSLAPIFRTIGYPDQLLDSVESVFGAYSAGSLKTRRSLEVLRNARENFETASPACSS